MQSHVKYRKYKSYKSGLLLLGLLVISWILITNINKSGVPAELAGLINADYENFRNLKQFDSAKTEEVRGLVAGFWTYSEGDVEKSPVVKQEYLELNANGMVWTVKIWGLRTPDGEFHTVTQIATGYMSPYSSDPSGGYYCETRIIRQAYIFNGDTCYGASQADEIWEVRHASAGTAGRLLTVNRREYQPYAGDLKEFFPDNALLDLVDKITLSACPVAANMSWASKKILARSMNAVPFFARVGAVESMIQTYYKPLVLDELARRYDPRAVPDVMDIRMTLSPEGAVTDFKYRGAKVVTKRFDDLAVLDMKSWLYPAVGDTDDPQTLEVKVRVK
ncbi:MAG: hypothetical protein LBC59_06175 [Chitinispirillales bacterium]|jgi:hypothetical protein|nr:hypothetical protein [Chitinispirillales bacterium]